mmetsp:Transcript_37495/g.43088  ORF Transcript_37495/g.43088 Transcript_37495/m.43088 type:complete len:83 (-) Transcript_37495:130-378(-)
MNPGHSTKRTVHRTNISLTDLGQNEHSASISKRDFIQRHSDRKPSRKSKAYKMLKLKDEAQRSSVYGDLDQNDVLFFEGNVQ